LGPKIGEQFRSSSKIVYLPKELAFNSNNNIPMFLVDNNNGYESFDDDGINEQQFNPINKNSLFLMLNNGEKYIKNQALKPQKQSYIIISIENISNQQQEEEKEEVKPPSIFQTTSLSTAPRL
jgi:hypothetical protein